MISQLPLGLRWPRRQRLEDFFAGSNAVALDAVQALAEQAGAPWLYLTGSSGSGKSHLLLAACQAAQAIGRTVQYLPLRTLADAENAIRGVAGSELIALDDLDAIAGQRDAEHAVFDLYNRSRAEGTALIFSADVVPSQLPPGLPDLRSRLGACTHFTLKPLDDDERREVLKSRAAARGMELEDQALDWLFAHYARDLGSLLDVLDRLDQASLAAQRRLTVPFLRGVLRAE